MPKEKDHPPQGHGKQPSTILALEPFAEEAEKNEPQASSLAPLSTTTKTNKMKDGVDQLIQLITALETKELAARKKPQPKAIAAHKFWSTQPVPQAVAELKGNQAIEPDKPFGSVPAEACPLPSPYVWAEVDVSDKLELKELYALLSDNYVEDDDSMFRFDYPAEFLRWALLPPGWKKAWHLGVRIETNRKLVAFISAIPVTACIYDKKTAMVEVNFLCVHKRLRSKRLSPVLIKEITRRVHYYGGLFQAVYTAGISLPLPISAAQYYHRPLNIKKLIECGFSSLPPGASLSRLAKSFALRSLPFQAPALRAMTRDDIPAVRRLLAAYFGDPCEAEAAGRQAGSGARFHFYPEFTSDEEMAHWLLPRSDVVHSFVVEASAPMASSRAGERRPLESFISFYELPSSVLQHATYKTIRTAYLFYYAVSCLADLSPLVMAVLAYAHQLGFDVFNCLNVMDNDCFIDALKFGMGDGQLRYYLYNWQTTPMPARQVALLML